MLPQDIEELRQLIVNRFVDAEQFELALTRAVQAGVPVDGLLVAEGLMDEDAYFRALSERVGVGFISHAQRVQLLPATSDLPLLQSRFDFIKIDAMEGIAICGFGVGPTKLRQEIEALRQSVSISPASQPIRQIFLTTFRAAQARYAEQFRAQLCEKAVNGLYASKPAESAKGGLSYSQIIGLTLLLIAVSFGAFQDFYKAAFVVSCGFAVFFFFVIALRIAAVLQQKSLALLFRAEPSGFKRNDQDLPVYTLLVPLFRETTILKQLVTALEELEYPKAKLDIKLLLEEVDRETIAAVQAMNLPRYFHILIVPDCQPRTKPKALNYGLQFAEGSYLVIYDAEDIPEPDQLRKALSLFARHGTKPNSSRNTAELATVQAKLNFYNPQQNWLTQQFTVEYGSLFDGLLPCYFNLGFPIPLGGTSNHFNAVM